MHWAGIWVGFSAGLGALWNLNLFSLRGIERRFFGPPARSLVNVPTASIRITKRTMSQFYFCHWPCRFGHLWFVCPYLCVCIYIYIYLRVDSSPRVRDEWQWGAIRLLLVALLFCLPIPVAVRSKALFCGRSLTEFEITLRHITHGRTSPDEWSARRRDLYLTKHNTHKSQTFMPATEYVLLNKYFSGDQEEWDGRGT